MLLKKISSSIVKEIRPYKPVEQKRNLYQCPTDIFQREENVLEMAKDFRNRLINPFSDWHNHLPSQGEEGYSILRKTIASYTNYVEKLSSKDAERFIKLAFGEEEYNAMKEIEKTNDDIKLFLNTLEQSLGKDIKLIISPN